LLEKLRDDYLAGVKDGFDVHCEDFVEFIFGDFEGWLFGALAQFSPISKHPFIKLQHSYLLSPKTKA